MILKGYGGVRNVFRRPKEAGPRRDRQSNQGVRLGLFRLLVTCFHCPRRERAKISRAVPHVLAGVGVLGPPPQIRIQEAQRRPSLDSHGGETANDSTILAIISLPVDVDFLLVFKVFVSLSQLVLFSLHVREPWN